MTAMPHSTVLHFIFTILCCVLPCAGGECAPYEILWCSDVYLEHFESYRKGTISLEDLCGRHLEEFDNCTVSHVNGCPDDVLQTVEKILGHGMCKEFEDSAEKTRRGTSSQDDSKTGAITSFKESDAQSVRDNVASMKSFPGALLVINNLIILVYHSVM